MTTKWAVLNRWTGDVSFCLVRHPLSPPECSPWGSAGFSPQAGAMQPLGQSLDQLDVEDEFRELVEGN